MAKAKLMEPLQQENKHGVAKRKWRNWPDICQRVFNETYKYMHDNQTHFLHPKSPRQFEPYWKTTCWNAAWTAADACQQALKDIIAMKGYAKAPKN
jgi:hypothetical protein